MLFPVGINQSFAQSNIANMINDPDLPVPMAPALTVNVFVGTFDEITIPFSEIVPPVTGNTFEQLTVTFSLSTTTQSLFGSFSTFTGTNQTTIAAADDALEVIADSVILHTAFSSGTELTFDYTVTNTNSVSASGVITIVPVNFIGEVMANPYTVTLADLSELPTVTRTILVADVASTILAGTQVAGPLLAAFTFSDIGTGDAAVGESAIGDQSGTLVVTNPTISSGTILVYTPASGFSGTETFDYTVSLEGKSGSSQFIFVVPVTVDAPTAPAITVEAATGSANILTIPFSEIIPDVSGNTFEELTVTFSLSSSSNLLHSGLLTFTGTDPTSLAAETSTLEVVEDTVVITTNFGTSDNDNIFFDYTVTNTDGVSASGVITYSFVNLVMANPHTVTLPDLFGLPIIDLPISLSDVEGILLANTVVPQFGFTTFEYATNGTGNGTATEPDGTIVPAPGTLTITNPSAGAGASLFPVFHYTPNLAGLDDDDFPYTEAFSYTVTSGDRSDSSTLYIVVLENVVCEITMVNGMDFGELQEGQTYENDGTSFMDITSESNTELQPALRGEPTTEGEWRSADGTKIMNVGQTRYFATNANYLDSTPFTDVGVTYGSELGDGEKVRVYQSLNIDLINKSFTGPITQEWRVGMDCSD